MKRLAVAYSIFIFIFTIAAVGIIYVSADYALRMVPYQTNYYSSDAVTAMNTIWTWWPVVVLVGAVIALFMAAQKRKMGEE